MSDSETEGKAEDLTVNSKPRASRAIYDKEKVEETNVQTKIPKKREQTEKQKEATKRMLAGLKTSR